MPQFSPAALSDVRLLAAYAIFSASYLVFALGKFPGMKIDRPGAAIIGAVLMVAFRIVPPSQALRFIDFGTLVLLFSMMLIVGNLRLVGFFEWITELVLRRLRPKHLLPTVIFTSGLLSAFFVNDIICLVMVPFVLAVARRMKVQPLPYLLAVATASNIGSVATITGNPQNMLIGSFSRISYRDFLAHLAPVALVGLAIDWAMLHWLCLPHEPAEALAVQAVPLQRPPASSLTKPAIVVAAVVVGFFAGVPPATMAALGAATLLITRTLDPRQLYDEVDWGLLVFFVGLFLIVGGAENAGIVSWLLDIGRHWNLQHSGVFTVVTAILSNLVSNVPAVMLLKSLVPGFANPHTGWLVLAMASTLAGNLTITGSVANIIVVESARPEVHISFRDYFRVGLPVTTATLLFGWTFLMLVH
ncbi:MAG TPA: anion transporter [Terriglobales bacterium]|nr:anion transporter [Terriglobales bacterium]